MPAGVNSTRPFTEAPDGSHAHAATSTLAFSRGACRVQLAASQNANAYPLQLT